MIDKFSYVETINENMNNKFNRNKLFYNKSKSFGHVFIISIFNGSLTFVEICLF